MCIFSNKVLSCTNEDIYKFLFNLYNIEAKKYNLPVALKLTGARKMVMSAYIESYSKRCYNKLCKENCYGAFTVKIFL